MTGTGSTDRCSNGRPGGVAMGSVAEVLGRLARVEETGAEDLVVPVWADGTAAVDVAGAGLGVR